MSKKYVYLFSEGNATMRELLGGKGANLAEMTNIGLPVPQGFTITTEACTQYYEDGRQINGEIMAATTSSFRPRFRMVSIMPGMEARAPERTETSRGFFRSPNFLPFISSIFATYSMISAMISSLILRPSS